MNRNSVNPLFFFRPTETRIIRSSGQYSRRYREAEPLGWGARIAIAVGLAALAGVVAGATKTTEDTQVVSVTGVCPPGASLIVERVPEKPDNSAEATLACEVAVFCSN